MRIGLPREVKDGEYRVALTPAGVSRLKHVVVEPGAGAEIGFTDEQYVQAGAALGDPWKCELVVKVKELQASEYAKPRRGHTIFGFQHFGPDPQLLDAALASGATFIAPCRDAEGGRRAEGGARFMTHPRAEFHVSFMGHCSGWGWVG